MGFRVQGSVEFRPDRLGWAEGAGGSGIKRLGEQHACEDRPLGFSVQGVGFRVRVEIEPSCDCCVCARVYARAGTCLLARSAWLHRSAQTCEWAITASKGPALAHMSSMCLNVCLPQPVRGRRMQSRPQNACDQSPHRHRYMPGPCRTARRAGASTKHTCRAPVRAGPVRS